MIVATKMWVSIPAGSGVIKTGKPIALAFYSLMPQGAIHKRKQRNVPWCLLCCWVCKEFRNRFDCWSVYADACTHVHDLPSISIMSC